MRGAVCRPEAALRGSNGEVQHTLGPHTGPLLPESADGLHGQTSPVCRPLQGRRVWASGGAQGGCTAEIRGPFLQTWSLQCWPAPGGAVCSKSGLAVWPARVPHCGLLSHRTTTRKCSHAGPVPRDYHSSCALLSLTCWARGWLAPDVQERGSCPHPGRLLLANRSHSQHVRPRPWLWLGRDGGALATGRGSGWALSSCEGSVTHACLLGADEPICWEGPGFELPLGNALGPRLARASSLGLLSWALCGLSVWEDRWPHKPCIRLPHIATKGELPLRLVRRVGEEQPSHPWASEGHRALHFTSQGLEGRSHPRLLSPILGNCCDVFLSNAVVTVDRFRVKTQGAEAPGPSGSAACSHVQAVQPVGQLPAVDPQVTGVGVSS